MSLMRNAPKDKLMTRYLNSYINITTYVIITCSNKQIMSSRLDPFFRVVFDQLNSQGLSYRFVCASLLEEGVTISPQALRSWHLRRGRKIAARSQQAIAPALRAGSTTAAGSVVLEIKLPIREQTMAAPAGHASHASLCEGRAPLQAQIEDEERRLLLQSAGQNCFPVRRKQVTDSSEQRISTPASWQTLKGNP